MPSILLIYDEELLAKLYFANLTVYLDSNVLKLSDLTKFNEVLKKNKIDLIVIVLTKNEESKFKYIKEFLYENGYEIPILNVGESRDKNKDAAEHEIKSYFSIQKIIRESAKALKITAKDMASKIVAKYYPIEINLLSALKKAPINLYKKVLVDEMEEYLLVSSKNDDLVKKIENWASEKIEHLYVNSNERLFIINAVSIALCENLTLTSLIKGTHRGEFLALNLDLIGKNLISEEVAIEVTNIANACTKIMSEIIKEAPDLAGLLEVFQHNKASYVYTHSMLSAYVASHIVKNVPWGGESHIDKLNYVLFFHDIALTPIFEKNPEIFNEEDLLFNGNLTEAEKSIVINHARISAELVASLKKSPIGSDLLIKQHHGMGNGVGFAIEYRDDISPLSKIIIISEAFIEELLIANKFSVQFDINNAIKNLNSRFSKHTYKKIIEPLYKLKI